MCLFVELRHLKFWRQSNVLNDLSIKLTRHRYFVLLDSTHSNYHCLFIVTIVSRLCQSGTTSKVAGCDWLRPLVAETRLRNQPVSTPLCWNRSQERKNGHFDKPIPNYHNLAFYGLLDHNVISPVGLTG